MLVLVDRIEGVRRKNNGNWMNLLRLAIQYAPEEAAKIMAAIHAEDSEITALSKELVNVGLFGEEGANEA